MRRKTIIDVEKASALYADGIPIVRIAQQLSLKEWTVRRRLSELGLNEGHEHRALRIDLNEHHLEMIDGLLLGDGTVATQARDTSGWLSVSQSRRVSGTDGRPWVREVHRYLTESGLLCSPLNEDKRNAYGPVLTAQTLSYKELIGQRYRWYRPWNRLGTFAGRPYKIVPVDLSLTPLALAWWFCGDGGGTISGGVELATCGFFVDDIDILEDKMQKLGFRPSRSHGKRTAIKPWTSNISLRLGVDDSYRLGKMILPHTNPCFSYKFDHLHRFVGKGNGHKKKDYLTW